MANPTDLVKVRLQAEGKLPAGVPRRYSGAMNAYSTIAKQVNSEFNPGTCMSSFAMIMLLQRLVTL